MKLRAADYQTELWSRLEATLKERLEQLRDENDEPHSPDETALLRGRIAEIRYILALPRYDEKARERERYRAQAAVEQSVAIY